MSYSRGTLLFHPTGIFTLSNVSPDSTFDFLVLSAHGAGAHAIFRYLELHPRIFPVRDDEPSSAAANPSRTYAKGIFSEAARTGWVFADLARLTRDTSIAAEITRVVKKSMFIQLVRDPIRMMLSVYNVRMQKALFGLGEKPAEIPVFFESLYDSALFYKGGKKLSTHFKQWTVFDTSDITGQERTTRTLRKMFDLLEVPTDETFYAHPALASAQNDVAQSFLRNYPIAIELFNVSFQCLLQTKGSLDFTGANNQLVVRPLETKGLQPSYEYMAGIVHDLPSELQTTLGVSELQVMVEANAWTRLHPKFRHLIVVENIVGNHVREHVLPLLAERIRKTSSFQKVTVQDLDSTTIDRVKTALAPDAQALFQKEPSLRQKWDVCGDI